MPADLAELEAIAGHQFQDRVLLERALTHKSSRFEKPTAEFAVHGDNEQLEFLGDSVLGFLVAEQMFRIYPTMAEGGLSKRKAHLVSAQRLFEAANAMDLGRFLRLGKGEEMSGGREKRALLANALEALIAALYLDGGIDVVRSFIHRYIISEFVASGVEGEARVNDFKSALQERTQRMGMATPRYAIVSESGPEHSKMFTVEVRVGKGLASRAQGLSKKAAGQKAAQQALEQLDQNVPGGETGLS
jgi:ribonuclease-3